MKRIAMVILLIAVILPVFAQENQTTLYGKFRLDYDLNQENAESSPATLGNFNVDRARLGIVWNMTDVLTGKIEVDAYEYALRIAEAKWAVTDSFTLGMGRMYEVFAPNSEWHATRFDGLGMHYSAGMATLALQIGNSRDGNPTALAIMPAITVAPETDVLSLEAGVNGKFLTPYLEAGDPDAVPPTSDSEIDAVGSANIYIIAEASGVEASVNLDINEFTDDASMHLDMNAGLGYGAGKVHPGISLFLVDMTSNIADMSASTEVAASYEMTEGLTSKLALALNNINEANGAEMSYKVTLRFEFNPKYTF